MNKQPAARTALKKPASGVGRRAFLAGSAAGILGLAAPAIRRAQAAEAIRIGEINSYSQIPAFTLPYRNGWQLAVEQINAAGGLLGGRPLEVISRDDGGDPGKAVTAAQELLTRHGVHALAGTFLSHVGLAVSDFARQRKVLFMASEPLTDALTWEKGNRYTYRLRPSTYMQAAMLAAEAAKLPITRWATIAPNYEYGQSAVARFKELLLAARPEVTFVAEQWPALYKLDAGPTVQALQQAEPEGLFNVLFGADLPKFVREGRVRGLFAGRQVVSMLTGEPEYLNPLKDEAPEGWIVTGYPWYDIDTAPHRAFVEAYRARWKEDPFVGSLVGYNTLTAMAVAFEKAGGTESETLVETLKDMAFSTPMGPLSFRASDHQSTMGAWVGRTALRDGKGVMVDWRYVDGGSVLPPPEVVSAWRPAG
ncbi:ABC transporter substrate-binding protein [Rhodospirillum rubrum]|uniref:Twin-arginine translocation pathway signal n=3 Tax=Rhodospirillum rubrum TaxID=1085 RepID=Q2RWX8_RHORT|nr:ABC transporter substrate-binding protein [Rhodospirillum rubrum]ABC21367.1 Twin-arginine translocation pathway signal [Rhodospirillum rubrum ATCC 11170]AEO47047.1 twin-arginine translocation pathway signal [Rhodospirillum rubrum F11]MBK5952953.1 ABC transporter substrate-binding protein [Rhodospirillum rubrum]QXG81045.1 ABC transporter substrate-binding protein [Rhodospirillum rubrum]HAP99441.1 ABC transporter substrate-binding protein [Rhodospirillum rubrum]